MLVFDVGANVGDKAARMRARGARVVCFEPQPHCAAALRDRFAADPGVAVEEMALGATPGQASLSICDEADVLSTLSEDWKTGRFRDRAWSRSVEVAVGTLAAAIARHGAPDYCKVDVEGFEREVLAGLDQALPLLSFEFTAEFRERALDCVARLAALGFTRFNISHGETARFALDAWESAEGLAAALRALRHPLAWGDIYAAREDPPAAVLALAEAETEAGTTEDGQALLLRKGAVCAGDPLRLVLGAGGDAPADHVRIAEAGDADVTAEIATLDFPPGSVEALRVGPVFGGLGRAAALRMLARWQCWLAPGGRLEVEAMDMLAIARALLAADAARQPAVLRRLEGMAGDGGAPWTAAVLAEALAALGFADVVVTVAPPDRLLARATRAVGPGDAEAGVAALLARWATLAPPEVPEAPPAGPEAEALRAALAAAEAREAAMRASTSGRLTRPLRALRGMLGGR